jgi:two-component system sensor histidine kinase EvgS
LYIAKTLCELQGGSIRVTSRPGGGSTFIACCEIRAVIPPPIGKDGDVNRSASEPATARPTQLRKALRILAVDDNVISRKILRRQLLQEGHDCSLANDGQQALVSLMLIMILGVHMLIVLPHQDVIHAHEQSGQRFDCVILDCNMPVLSGMECARRLRAEEKQGDPESKSYRIIGCTGQARPEQVGVEWRISQVQAGRAEDDLICRCPRLQIQAAVDAGFDQLIIKPCESQRLAGRVLLLPADHN